MSSKSTTRASSPNATVQSDPLLAWLLAPLRLFLAPCTAPVTSRLVTFSARSGLLVQRSLLYPGFDSCFPRVRTALYLGPLSDPMCEAAGALRVPPWLAVLAS